MRKSTLVLGIICLFFISACKGASGPSAVVSPVAPAGSPSPQIRQAPVLVGYLENPATITLFNMNGSVIKSMPGYPLADEHAIGAFLVTTSDASGGEFTVDRSGLTKPVAPAAARILNPATTDNPIIIDANTAIVGCAVQTDGSCTAEVVNMATGEVRPMLNVAGTGAASMRLGPSLTLLNISPDLNVIWLRRVTNASAAQADIVGIDIRTAAMKALPLPAALMGDQILAISPDGTMVAGQEEAGTDPNHVIVEHLHVASLLTGSDTDVQGTAPYVSGGRPPEILFAPDGRNVAWWGSLNGSFNSGIGQRVNFAPTDGLGKTLWLDGTTSVHVTELSWLDRATVLVQADSETATIDVTTGTMHTLEIQGMPFPYLAAVLV